MPRWFVTGAGGQLATAFEQVLEGEVFMAREAALDIRDADALSAAVRAFSPDVVLHTAAYTDVDGAEADATTAFAVNVGGTRNVVQAVRGTHTLVVLFSTDYVFDGTKGSPYVESDAPAPLNVYGRSKLAAENIVLGWARGMVVRTSWLFSETGRNFVKSILTAGREKAGTGEPLRVVDDQVGSPTYAGHLAAAVDETLRQGVEPGLYHMAGSGYCSWHELACEVVAAAGLPVEVRAITTAELGRPAQRPAFSALASERPVPRLPHWADGVRAAVDRLTALGQAPAG
ncbi:MAG TPA: dTDP-4-dehydrorhamnose reductase [Thermoleophilia bacterium]|nr:dTDP-4-dehydrorhamnose reductase [Thermoleophilia bacterium]HQG54185.1 dTDP-4-dehydrorhamnose reductase [Thermoleophilia bacterium]HQJ98350.1 dTDP-4-dehydrorhamnose reductase [Thermoleophilia bacterium]